MKTVLAFLVTVSFFALVITIPGAIIYTSANTIRLALLNLFFLFWLVVLFSVPGRGRKDGE